MKLSGRQKKKFRRIVNKSIQSGEKPESIQIPREAAKTLQEQVDKAFLFKGRKLKNQT